MKLGKLIGQVVALPIKVAVELPQTAADVVEEIGKAVSGEEKP